MPFKHGRITEAWLNSIDASVYLNSIDFETIVDTDDATTFKATWKSSTLGAAVATAASKGFFDGTQAAFKDSTIVTTTEGILTYGPGGLAAVGDLARLMLIDDTDYKESSPVGGTVLFDWGLMSTSVVGFGVCLHPLTADSVGTNNGAGNGVITGAQSTTGAIATLHVTAMGGGTQNFKLQDATTIGGAYSDIAGGAFTAVTGVGAQRLVIPGTIRAFVRVVSTIVTAPVTFGVAFART